MAECGGAALGKSHCWWLALNFDEQDRLRAERDAAAKIAAQAAERAEEEDAGDENEDDKRKSNWRLRQRTCSRSRWMSGT